MVKRFWRWLIHECLQWHNCGGAQTTGFDGCSMHGTCTCGKKVMLDSQGNWF